MFDLLWVKHLRYAKEKKRDRKAWSKYVKKKKNKKKTSHRKFDIKGRANLCKMLLYYQSVHVYFRLIASVINSHQIFYFAIAPFAFKIFV